MGVRWNYGAKFLSKAVKLKQSIQHCCGLRILKITIRTTILLVFPSIERKSEMILQSMETPFGRYMILLEIH